MKNKNIKAEQINAAIGEISDNYIESADTLRTSGFIGIKKSGNFVYKQFAGIAAALVLLVAGTFAMLRIFAPDDIILPPDDVVAPPVEPIPAWLWLVEPTLEYAWIEYCAHCDMFLAAFNTFDPYIEYPDDNYTAFELDRITGQPTGTIHKVHNRTGEKTWASWVYDPDLDLFGWFQWFSLDYELYPMSEFAERFPNEVDRIRTVRRYDTTVSTRGSEFLPGEGYSGDAVMFGNEFITDFIYITQSNPGKEQMNITAVNHSDGNDGGKHGIINKDGVWLVPFESWSLVTISETTAFAGIDGKWGIIGFGASATAVEPVGPPFEYLIYSTEIYGSGVPREWHYKGFGMFFDLTAPVIQYHEFVASEELQGIIAFSTEVTLRNFQFFNIRSNHNWITDGVINENESRYHITDVLYSLDELANGKPLIVRGANLGCANAANGFSFTDENGETRSFALYGAMADFDPPVRAAEVSMSFAPPAAGNTPANIQNGGRVAEHNGWVYYESTSGGIRKMREDGTEMTIVSERHFTTWPYINVIGDSIFYTDFCFDTLTSILYKSSLDGADETILLSFTDKTISNVTVIDDWLYYIGIFRGSRIEGINDDFIYRMCLDGTEHTQLSNVRSLDMMIDDGWIYYIGYTDWVDDVYFGINYIYKMRLDGSERTRFNDAYDNIDINTINEHSDEMAYLHTNRISSFLVNNGWIYYVTENYKTIYKIRTDFTDKTVVIPEPDDELMLLQTLHAASDWLYYYEFAPMAFPGNLKRVNRAGEIQAVLSDAGRIYIAGEWIYYYTDEFAFHKVRLDGTGRETVE
jgi:hypothetical protein